jgi:hypothetical protein
MGFNIGTFLGAAGTTGLNTYRQLAEENRQQQQFAYEQDQRNRMKALSDQLQEAPKVGQFNPNATQQGGMTEQQVLEKYGQGAITPADISHGDAVDIPGKQPETNPNSPMAPTALPTNGSDQISQIGQQATSPSPQTAIPPQARLYAYRDPSSGQMMYTHTPTKYTSEDTAQHQADTLIRSGIPTMVAQGTTMQNQIAQNKLIAQQGQELGMKLQLQKVDFGVRQAQMQYKQGNIGGALDMLSQVYNQDVPNGFHADIKPVAGDPTKAAITHRDAQGNVLGVEQIPIDEMFNQAAAITSPEGFANFMLKQKTLQADIDKNTQMGQYYAAEMRKIDAAIKAGMPAAEVAKMRAEAEAALTNAGANRAYKQALEQEVGAKTNLQNQINDINTKLQDPKLSPDERRVMMEEREALNGRYTGIKYTTTSTGQVIKYDPLQGESLYNNDAKMFLPTYVDGDKLAKDPDFKAGNVTPQWSDKGFGFHVKGMPANQIFQGPDALDEAKAALKKAGGKGGIPTPASTITPSGGGYFPVG